MIFHSFYAQLEIQTPEMVSV